MTENPAPMNKEMLTTDDLSEYLQIHKNQIYRLIRERKIPATRLTGKWLFPKQLVDQWVIESAKDTVRVEKKQEAIENRIVIAGSNDIALEALTKSVQIRHPSFTVSLSNVGSLAGLLALRRGTCHIAASHLLDAETGEYNTSHIKKSFSDLKVRVVNLAHREQGLLIKKGNPLGIRNLKDLAGKKAVFINRQEGSGTRVLLDFRLKESRIDPSEISGYTNIAYTHMEVALAILGGAADIGMGIRAAAKLLGLDFIPIANERFDLIIPNEYYSTEAVSALRESLDLSEFKSYVTHLGGYETYDTGKIFYEMG
jgi:putative molybdopterin biosynthesis protein